MRTQGCVAAAHTASGLVFERRLRRPAGLRYSGGRSAELPAVLPAANWPPVGVFFINYRFPSPGVYSSVAPAQALTPAAESGHSRVGMRRKGLAPAGRVGASPGEPGPTGREACYGAVQRVHLGPLNRTFPAPCILPWIRPERRKPLLWHLGSVSQF